MERPESQRKHTAASTQQVLTGSKEDFADQALKMIEGRRSGKLLLEVFFEDGFAVDAQLHAKFACKR